MITTRALWLLIYLFSLLAAQGIPRTHDSHTALQVIS